MPRGWSTPSPTMNAVFSMRANFSDTLRASHASMSTAASSISFCVALGIAYSSLTGMTNLDRRGVLVSGRGWVSPTQPAPASSFSSM